MANRDSGMADAAMPWRRCACSGRAIGLATALICLALSNHFASADEPRSFVIRAKRVIPVLPDGPWVYEPGVVVVYDGKVVAVGSDIGIPDDLPVVEFADATVMPGLVAAATSLAPPHTGDESIAAGYRAVDAFLPRDNFATVLAGGVTTVHLNPGDHRLLTGQGAVVRLGGPLAGRVLKERADLTITLGERAFHPPRDVTYQTPASSDVAIPPAVRQRPDSRMGQMLGLEEALARAESGEWRDIHGIALREAWDSGALLRLQVQRNADIAAGIAFLRKHNREGYLVGGAEAHLVRSEVVNARIPLVYQLPRGLRGGAGDVGYDPDRVEAELTALAMLGDVPLALATWSGEPVSDLRLAAATALRAGLSERRVIESITRVPAEIIGVADRVGSLAPGRDADIVVFSGDPLATGSHVERVYIAGELAFEAPKTSALVVRAGTIWIDENRRIRDGAVLVENGVITAVGHSVPHPPFARFIDAGSDGFITPGFIDAFGHLGLDGDRASTSPELSLATIVGVPGPPERRVAKSGVTTVLVAPYSSSPQGSQIAAVRTGGKDRDARMIRATAGVVFDLRETDPMDVGVKFKKRLEEGKKYLEKWRNFEKELAEWKEKKAKGEPIKVEAKREVVKEAEEKPDPITGTWTVTLSGGPIEQSLTATMKLRLSGSDIEGRIMVPGQPEEAKVTGTFDGKHISGTIDVETPFGPPAIEADLIEDDHIVGVVKLAEIKIDLDAKRTSKESVEFKIVKKKTRGKEGEPLPPTVDEGLEPIRAILEKKISAVVAARTPAQIDAALKVAKEFEVSLVVLEGDGAAALADRLVEQSVGVIVPADVYRFVDERWYHEADDLSRKGVAVAFQSNAEDAARSLPLIGLRAVERGMAADAALAAFTRLAAKMYKLDDKIGSLQPGRLGDLLIFKGHPFETGSRLERVIIGGEDVE